MTICILGRQPEIGLAELEALYGAENVRPVGETCALVNAEVDFSRLGGTVKTADLLSTVTGTNLRAAFAKIGKLLPKLATDMPEGKVKLGLSLYGYDMKPYNINGEALRLKRPLKNAGRSVRVVPNETPALSSAQTFHNSLAGDLGLEFVIIEDNEQTLVGRVTHVQNIDSYRLRDRERPKRDAFVGMLPPKLAQIIVNLAVGDKMEDGEAKSQKPVLLDPFCGTGVIPQEALIMGYDVYGTDISQKMVDYSKENIDWLSTKFEIGDSKFELADASDHIWLQPINVIACEGYLGQPLGGLSPTREKMQEIIHECNSNMRGFLKNITLQLAPGTRLCVAMPAWYINGQIYRLPVIEEVGEIGFERVQFTHAPAGLLYRREDQVTGRELIVLVKR